MCVGGRKVEGVEGDLKSKALTPVFSAPSPVPVPHPLQFFPFRSSGAGISTWLGGGEVAVCKKCLAGENRLRASASSTSALTIFPSPRLEWFGKSKLPKKQNISLALMELC